MQQKLCWEKANELAFPRCGKILTPSGMVSFTSLLPYISQPTRWKLHSHIFTGRLFQHSPYMLLWSNVVDYSWGSVKYPIFFFFFFFFFFKWHWWRIWTQKVSWYWEPLLCAVKWKVVFLVRGQVTWSLNQRQSKISKPLSKHNKLSNDIWLTGFVWFAWVVRQGTVKKGDSLFAKPCMSSASDFSPVTKVLHPWDHNLSGFSPHISIHLSFSSKRANCQMGSLYQH